MSEQWFSDMLHEAHEAVQAAHDELSRNNDERVLRCDLQIIMRDLERADDSWRTMGGREAAAAPERSAAA